MRAIRILKISAFILVMAACLSVNHSVCYAALGVEPESIELVAGPDTITAGAYNVTNDGGEPVRVVVQPEEWPRRADGKVGFPVKEWLDITPMEFDLAPRERKEARFTIKPPAGHPGELSAMIFFATTSAEGVMNITTRNGVSLYAAFADRMLVDCAVDSISVSRFQQKSDAGTIDRGIVFTINIENRGNVHLRPVGSIEITDKAGAKYDVNIERGFPAYAGGKGIYEVLWDKKDIAPGKYEARIALDYGRLYKLDKKVYKKISFTINEDRSVSF